MSMKRIIQQLFCLVLIASGLGFHACQQGDEVDLDNMAKKSGTRAEGDIICEIETKEPGKLDSLINVFVKDAGYARESINILSLKGPLNPTDISTICGFQYLDSLNMEKVTMMTAEGDTTTVFDGFRDKFKNPNAVVVLPEMLTEIGNRALAGSEMRAAILCEGVTKINSSAFSSSTVQSVVCPKSLVEISNNAFYHCDFLTQISLANRVSIIGAYAFACCKSLEEISLADTRIKLLSESMFTLCDKLVTIKLPSTLVTIEREAFCNCPELKEVDIPQYVREIEDAVFMKCSKLERVAWPSKVTSIPNNTFRDCPLMKTEIPDWVVSVGDYAYCGCKASETLTVPARVKSIGVAAFAYQNIVSVKLEEGTPLSQCMFEGCAKLENIVLPGNIAGIPASFLKFCKSLKTINLPKSVTYIGNYALEGTGLSSIVLPVGVTEIGSYAFQDCAELKEIKLNEGLQIVYGGAFRGTALETLTIPSTVTRCDEGIVTDCPHITAVFWNSLAQAPDLTQDWERNLLVYLPAGGSSVKENSNQIVDGHALNIYLTEDGDFKCPKEFKADKIYFTKDFSWDWDYWNKPFTAPGKSAGWLTMALPFAVSKIYTEETNSRVLAPFNAGVVDSKPFWLRELTSEGFKNVTKIEANKPYLVAMPYNDDYLPEYNIRCKVTFMGENVTIPVTTEPATVTGPEYDFTPTYHNIGYVADKLITNKKAYYHTPTGKGYEPGSIFLANDSEILVFDAYITTHKTNTRLIEIVPSARTRAVKKVGKIPSIDDM